MVEVERENKKLQPRSQLEGFSLLVEETRLSLNNLRLERESNFPSPAEKIS